MYGKSRFFFFYQHGFTRVIFLPECVGRPVWRGIMAAAAGAAGRDASHAPLAITLINQRLLKFWK